MLLNLFIDLKKYKQKFLNWINSWNDFELKFKYYLKNNLLLKEIDKKSINNFIELKSIILNKKPKNIFIKNENWKNLKWKFIFQPFGSQSYPDFIIFFENFLIPLEIKFNKNNGNPMWNSGYPKKNWIYIYWNWSKEDVTFFLGDNVLNDIERNIMEEFFYKLKILEQNVNKELIQYDINNTGFQVYIRKAFNQKNTKNNTEVSFLNNSKRRYREENVIKFISLLK